MEELAQRKRVKSKVDRMADGLGRSVDEGIKSMVITLNILGFQTIQSCEGHLKRALPYPWVWITQCIVGGVSSSEKMSQLLDSFSKLNPEHNLFMVPRGTRGDFKLQCNKDYSTEEVEKIPISLRRRMLSSTREDMNAFCDFLESHIEQPSVNLS